MIYFGYAKMLFVWSSVSNMIALNVFLSKIIIIFFTQNATVVYSRKANTFSVSKVKFKIKTNLARQTFYTEREFINDRSNCRDIFQLFCSDQLANCLGAEENSVNFNRMSNTTLNKRFKTYGFL